MRWVWRILAGLVALVVVLAVAIRVTTFHPADVATEDVACAGDAPTLEPGQQLDVMSWNVQYMAGTGYVFWYDLPDGDGPDDRPTTADITATFDEVVRIIEDAQPDVLLLQEVDDGAARTDGEDQLVRLQELLADPYPCTSSAFYWKAAYAPHPRILGSVGMKLSTLSRFQIDEATRYQLPQMPSDLLTRQFDIRRAILETRLPVTGAEDLVVLNTHLDAFAQGSDTMERQVALAKDLLDDLTAAGEPWLLGGDMNLLPPGPQYDALAPAQQAYYAPDTELSVLTDAYASVPSVEESSGPDRTVWFTHQPNDPAVDGPDRTIDFLFHAPTLTLGEHSVRAADTLEISDHLPVVATYTLPAE
jgi:endonuclease/exonuclease/phosphatase family metal-dependent hydrolase